MSGFVQSGRFGGASWTPTDLASLAGWWDASDSGSFTYSSGTLVSQWNDLSGMGRHLTQATVSLQPSRNATVNGLDAVQSDTSDDMMSTGSFTVAQPFTVLAVAKRGTTIPDYSVLWQSVGGGGSRPILFAKRIDSTPTNGSPNFYAGSLQGWSSVLTSGEVFAFANTYNGASSAGWKNGASASLAGSPGSSAIDSGFRIGNNDGATCWGGAWCEIILCSAALSTGDREAAETYLTTKWGI